MAPEELTQRVAEALAPLEAVRVAWVFGSRIAGTATDRSDLDVAVVFVRALDDAERERMRRSIVAALTDAMGAVGERADVVDVDRASSSVAFRAIRDGRRALARSEGERVAAEVRIARRYDDEAPKRELYRRAARVHAGAHGGRS
jgi:predicted nucleotidyltransferase